MSHFAEFLPVLADYLAERDREQLAEAMGEDSDRLPGPRSADLLADLEQRWVAAVNEAARAL